MTRVFPAQCIDRLNSIPVQTIFSSSQRIVALGRIPFPDMRPLMRLESEPKSGVILGHLYISTALIPPGYYVQISIS